ncbi:MAG: Alginate O-acetyltransferase [Candidatus Nitrospira kreftii]|uniref:Alginate O-acetyltransferase n=1 Tax=Candidatus Nitrospira kreftii TaxID=2652173 RepID=A0A7S8IYZ6_9BACT|nr:MAG: Alginate O-acetyltransferase [Candidatus Nitrospira kreftii]
MLFNSIDFILFFVVVTGMYFALPHRFRWLLLLAASCFFYMAFVPIYILILFTAIIIDYFAAIWIENTEDSHKKTLYLQMSIASVCGILFVFKYFNFFNQNIAILAKTINWNYPIESLQIILPIGLSFHTFQSLSYVLEVYHGRQRAERHFGIYSLYVMYFPQLVAGPIERPQNMLHQFHERKHFDWSHFGDGLSLILWGLFKKVVVADNLALYVDTVYNSSSLHTGTSLLFATYFFAFQIYSDFSGYSDIARGVSHIYGIELMKNFETPYFSKSIPEFWSRWHISLSTWFRDYVYIPMGGNRVSPSKNIFNLLAVFLLSGFWHGASWTFVIWGGLHGLYVIAYRLIGCDTRCQSAEKHQFKSYPLVQFFKLILTFHLVLLAWVFFRAENIATAMLIIKKIALDHGPLFRAPTNFPQAMFVTGLLLALDWVNRKIDYWDNTSSFSLSFRTAYAVGLFFAIVIFGMESGSQFIYFQF